jgi:hypothetical protein
MRVSAAGLGIIFLKRSLEPRAGRNEAKREGMKKRICSYIFHPPVEHFA